MRTHSPLPDDFAESPFSRRSALDAGVTDSRMRARDLARPFHGIRMPVDREADFLLRCAAYLQWIHPRHAFGRETAARLYGLPLPLYVEDGSLHVTSPTPHRPPAGAGVTGSELDARLWKVRDVVLRDEPTGQLFAPCVVDPCLAWAQLACVLDPDDLVAVGDAIVTALPRPGLLENPVLASVGELRRTAAAHSGRRGAKAMAAAVARIRVGPLSRPESLLRLILLRAGFPEPELNVEVTDRVGRSVATPDLSWPEFRVLIEYEGEGHRTSSSKFRSDITRGERYADAEWFQLRASADDVFRDPNDFVGRLARRLAASGWRPPRRGLRRVTPARH